MPVNDGNPIPKTAFSFEDTFVALDAGILDVVVGVSARQLSEKHRYLMITLTLGAIVVTIPLN